MNQEEKLNNMKETIKEFRVYVVDTSEEIEGELYFGDDNNFMDEAEAQGRVYTLKGFQNAFNNDEINTSTDLIKIIQNGLDFMTTEKQVYLFDDWLKWLNKQGITITIEHEDFKEHYQNLKTFRNNLQAFKQYEL